MYKLKSQVKREQLGSSSEEDECQDIESDLFPLHIGSSQKTKVEKKGIRSKYFAKSEKNRVVMSDILNELNKLPCQARRLIERRGGSHPNVITRGNLQSYLYLYHEIIDTTWFRLFFIVFVLFLLFNLLFATLFWAINGVIDTTNDISNVGWFDCFNFALQSMDTIGYGGLQPKGNASNWIVFIQSYFANVFWTLFTALIFAKLARPSRLKRTIKFSNYAVINRNTKCFVPIFPDYDNGNGNENWNENESKDNLRGNEYNNEYNNDSDAKWSEYGSYEKGDLCLVFRFGDMRYRSRICESAFNLICLKRKYIFDENDKTIIAKNELNVDYTMIEMDFEINYQKGRVRSMNLSTPLLSLPWTVVHRIDQLSPLWGMTKQDMINQNIEIIAVLDGIDEATSDNFQSWFSYTMDDIKFDYQFVPMVSSNIVKATLIDNHGNKQNTQKEMFQIDYDKISSIVPIQTVSRNAPNRGSIN